MMSFLEAKVVGFFFSFYVSLCDIMYNIAVILYSINVRMNFGSYCERHG